MTYHQLTLVNDIDSKITELNQSLQNLYLQRDRLIDRRLSSRYSKNASIPTVATLTQQLRQAWEQVGVKMPEPSVLKILLTKAINRYQELVRLDSSYAHSLSFVLVPPKSVLQSATSHLGFTMNDARIAMPYSSRRWRVILVLGPSFDVVVGEPQVLTGQNLISGLPYDVCRLGIYEVMAAELQGCPIVLSDRWTLLLKGKQPVSGPLCAVRQGDNIMFDIDDSNGLLGDNYLTLAIEAN